jgi:hypothetical protein
VDPRADLDDVEKRKFLTLPGLELPPLGRRARSQSLYRLRSQEFSCKKISGREHQGAWRQDDPSRGGVTSSSQTRPFIEEDAPFQNT